MSDTVRGKIALIDPVGMKAGMDHYDLLLLEGIASTGATVLLYSNFEKKNLPVRVIQVFYNLNTSKLQSVSSTIFGFFKSLFLCKKEKVQWLVLHVFRAGMFDLLTFFFARLMGFRICAIVHDIESLDTISFPFVRKIVIDYLPNKRVVHNAFSLYQLSKRIRTVTLKSTVIIPHVNFVHLFAHYHQQPALLLQLKNEKTIAAGIHGKLPEYIDQGKKIFLFFGQIKQAKGLEILLKAVAETEGDYKLIVAGRVREGNWSQYSSLIDSLGIGDKIIPVIRYITDQERDFMFAISHAIVLPYTRIYQSGVLLMAMSFPLTVIASDLSPNTDIITQGVNGLIFKSEDVGDLSEKMKVILQDTSRVNALNSQALIDVKERYNPIVIGRKFSEILN